MMKFERYNRILIMLNVISKIPSSAFEWKPNLQKYLKRRIPKVAGKLFLITKPFFHPLSLSSFFSIDINYNWTLTCVDKSYKNNNREIRKRKPIYVKKNGVKKPGTFEHSRSSNLTDELTKLTNIYHFITGSLRLQLIDSCQMNVHRHTWREQKEDK